VGAHPRPSLVDGACRTAGAGTRPGRPPAWLERAGVTLRPTPTPTPRPSDPELDDALDGDLAELATWVRPQAREGWRLTGGEEDWICDTWSGRPAVVIAHLADGSPLVVTCDTGEVVWCALDGEDAVEARSLREWVERR